MTEEWRVIPAYPDYAISDLGRVKRLTSRTCAKANSILKQCWRGGRGEAKGYLAVNLCGQDGARLMSVHSLVADAFLEMRPDGHIPNHIDGDRSNNRRSNLEWVTQSQNVKHAYSLGLADAKGERNGKAKLTSEAVIAMRRMYGNSVTSYDALGRQFNISARQAADIIKGKAWPHLLAA